MRRCTVLLALVAVGCPKPDSGNPKDDSAVVEENRPPVLTIDSPRERDAFAPGESVRLSGWVVDDQDGPQLLTLVVASDVDGGLPAPTVALDGTFTLDISTLSNATHALSVQVTDSAGLVASDVVQISVDPSAVNAPPEPGSIGISPADPVTGDALQVESLGDCVDEEGAPVTTQVAWFRNGVPYTTGATVAAGVVYDQDLWRATRTCSDGENTASISTEVVIGNAAPVISRVEVQPSDPTVSTELSCIVVGYDPEGALLSTTLAWSLDGVDIGWSDAVLPAGRATWNQEVVCTATLSDQQQSAQASSAAVTIGNEPPSAPTIEISPAAPLDTDDLSCAVATPSVDPDGQTITYAVQWYVDGVPAATTWTVPAADTHRDELWTCEVFGTDSAGGASGVTNTSVQVGLAWVGSNSASGAEVTIDGQSDAGLFGKSIALTGDIDGDGLSELAVGASGEYGNRGSVYLFSGASLNGALTTTDATASWTGSFVDGALASYRSMSAPGDLDGDGSAELLFGAPEAAANGEGSGVVYLLYGGGSWGLDGDPQTQADWILTGDANDTTGVRMSVADIDGDGDVDILASSTGASASGRRAGTVGVYLGSGQRFSGSARVDQANWSIYGDRELDELGWTLKAVGDVNDDGYEDFAATSFYAEASAGQMGLFFGRANPGGSGILSGLAGAVFTGSQSGDRLGYDVVGQLDVDEDGIDDLVVGAYLDDTVGADAGALHVYLGRGTWASDYLPSDADATVLGGGSGDRFGHVLASPGDLDSDGVEDLLIGALFTEPTGAADQGSAYLLLGPDWASFSGAADLPWQSYGEGAGDLFGDALGVGRGDINGDGRADFAVGAQRHDQGAADAGRVYLWFGR